MPTPKGRRRERPSKEEVRCHWDALSPARRQDVLRFEDRALLTKIREALSTLYERQTVMKALGLTVSDSDDPLEESIILKQGFEFSWQGARHSKDSNLVMLDTAMQPILVAKTEYVQQGDLIDQISCVLPDFLSPKCPRQVAPKARWKDIFGSEPANVGEMEQQLARLVEQAMWAMVSDPAFKVEEDASPSASASSSTAVELEPWMEEHDARVKKRSERQKARKAKMTPQPLELVEEEGASEPAVIACHYWRTDAREEPSRQASQESEPADEVEPSEPAQASTEEPSREAPVAQELPPTPPSSPRVGAQVLTLDVEEVCREPGPDESEQEPIVFGSFGVSSLEDNDAETLQAPEAECAAWAAGADEPSEPCSPTMPPVPRDGTWQPPQLVQYIWGQFAQPSKTDLEQPAGSERGFSSSTTETPSSVCSGTPMRRGHWVQSSSQTPLGSDRACFRAVVRNTFIDIDQRSECSTPGGSRTSRSLSPSLLRRATEPFKAPEPVESAGFDGAELQSSTPEENDTWYWYWH